MSLLSKFNIGMFHRVEFTAVFRIFYATAFHNFWLEAWCTLYYVCSGCFCFLRRRIVEKTSPCVKEAMLKTNNFSEKIIFYHHWNGSFFRRFTAVFFLPLGLQFYHKKQTIRPDSRIFQRNSFHSLFCYLQKHLLKLENAETFYFRNFQGKS